MSSFTRSSAHQTLLYTFLFVLAGCTGPFSCANFKESHWPEFNFSVDSPAEVASTVFRLWGVEERKLGVTRDRRGNIGLIYWRSNLFTPPIGRYMAWFQDGVLQKIDVEWFGPRPTLSQAVDCLGTPEYYIAFHGNGWENLNTTLDLLYPEKGYVVRYKSPYGTEPPEKFHPFMQIKELAVVAPGTPEQMVPAVYSVGRAGGYVDNACLSKPWPGAIEGMEVPPFYTTAASCKNGG